MRLHNPNLSQKAKELRKNITKQEKRLWYCFFKTLNSTVYRQKVLGSYIVDFYCPAANVVIEIDGSQHFEEKNRDYEANRTIFLMEHGFTVLRYSNRDIDTNFDNVCADIYRHIFKD